MPASVPGHTRADGRLAPYAPASLSAPPHSPSPVGSSPPPPSLSSASVLLGLTLPSTRQGRFKHLTPVSGGDTAVLGHGIDSEFPPGHLYLDLVLSGKVVRANTV